MTSILYMHEHGEISGGEISLLTLWGHLDRARFRPLLIAPCPSRLADRARRMGVDVRAIDIPNLRALANPEEIRTLRLIRRLILDEGVRIVHGNTPRTNLLGSLAALGTGCRVVWHERTLPGSQWDVDAWLRFLPDCIVCNSAAVARRFGSSVKTTVILNGVRLDHFHPGAGGAALRGAMGIGPHEVVVGLVGNFSPVKGHEVFLHAASHVAVRLPAVRFWIVGAETFPDNAGREACLRTLARTLGLDQVMRFMGPRDDMPAVMDALDVVAAPSHLEACSRALLEAMAAGTPVIATNVGGNPELIEDGLTGILIAAGDVEALAQAVGRLALDADLRRHMGNAARKKAEAEFSVGRQVRQTEAMYDQLAGPF